MCHPNKGKLSDFGRGPSSWGRSTGEHSKLGDKEFGRNTGFFTGSTVLSEGKVRDMRGPPSSTGSQGACGCILRMDTEIIQDDRRAPSQHFILKVFKNTTELQERWSEYSSIQYLGSILIILLYLFDHVSVHPHHHPSTHLVFLPHFR